jgi:hypothetical protein
LAQALISKGETTMSMRIVTVCVVAALLACPAAHAQDEDRADLWRSYAQRLPPHSLVVVQLKNGKSVRGHLVQVMDDRVVVLKKTRLPVPPTQFVLTDIESIEPQKVGWSPGAKVLAGVGSAAGILLIITFALLAGYD